MPKVKVLKSYFGGLRMVLGMTYPQYLGFGSVSINDGLLKKPVLNVNF